MRPIITMPVPPLVYGSDQSYGDFWRNQYRKLLAQSTAVQLDRDEWVTIATKALDELKALRSEQG
jgi:hypothetical protein